MASRGRRKSQVLIGKKLDDNIWHTVNILKIKQLVQIKLDDKFIKTVLVPGVSTQLKLNKELYIGGVDVNMLPDTLKTLYLINFRGCIKSVEVDKRKPIESLKHKNGRAVIHGQISLSCKTAQFQPVRFPTPKSKLEVLRKGNSGTEPFFVEINFRTFDSEGILLFAEANQCHVFIGIQRGMVYLELRQDEVLKARIESFKGTANGLWHSTAATITLTEIFLETEKGYRVSSRLPKISSGYNCHVPTRVFIGGGAEEKLKRGFVGCVNHLIINRRKVNMANLSEVIPSGVKLNECDLVDQCFPNPCRNGGKCTQNWYSYGCDCSKTTFYGKHCNLPIYKPTCSAYETLGLSRPSYCILDSDGTGDLKPYTSLCNKTTAERGMATIVHHDREKRVRVSEGNEKFRGSHFHYVSYELDMEKIEALIKNSKQCRQFIRFDCYNAILLNAPSGLPNGAWTGRDGDVKSYWGGVTAGSEGCKCGLTQSCEKKEKLCNCDSLNNKWTNDSGYIVDKQYLPVTRMQFTDISKGFAYITLGPLECTESSKKTDESEQPPRDILSKVCMTISTTEYMMANETLLTWMAPVEIPKTVPLVSTELPTLKRKISSTTGSTTSNSTSTRKATSEISTTNRFANTEVTKMHQNNSGNYVVRYPVEGPPQERNLSILEIILIIFAAFSITVLVGKFVVMKGIKFVRKRYQIKRLYHHERNGAESQRALRPENEQCETPMTKKGGRRGMGTYWV